MSKRTWIGLLIVAALISVPFALSRSGPDEGRLRTRADQVGVVYITGLISTQSGGGPMVSGSSQNVVDLLEDIEKDPNVRAVVVRVDSGGGSAAASQEIHRAMTKVSDAGKPIVVSMGEVAASGGYYVSVAADRILANPTTITGSIGVISQFLNISGLAEEHGFSLESVATGPYKDTGNPTKPLTDEQRAMLQALNEDGLDYFVEAIAEGRGLSTEAVRSVADGRIMTGGQAAALGLIDGFGGLSEAIELAAELAGIEGEPAVRHFVKERTWIERYIGIELLVNALWHRLTGATLTEELLTQIFATNREITLRY